MMSTLVHPRHFADMTPRQRRQLAARRRKEVDEAATAPRGVDLGPLIEALATLIGGDPMCRLCGKPAKARGMCAMHYKRWQRAMAEIRSVA